MSILLILKRGMIAPCGMNCAICKYHYRKKNTCPGCRSEDEEKLKGCRECIIVNCDEIKKKGLEFCFSCSIIPCKRLKNLDKRYKTKYHMSMLENLEFIKNKGVIAFLEKEEDRWKCLSCGGIVTCHGGMCLSCDVEKFKTEKE